NYGAAFGMLAGKSWLLVPIAVVFVVYLIVEREKINSIPLARWGAPLAAAGALGNAIDRVFLGYVVDFIDVPFFSVFNVADIGITIGIFLLLFGLVLNERNHKDGASDV
ncbi:MAG TPA: signal peptidase II, partial [Bacillota bacterium]|nr:signal peptidase II [Bacillota bacterium]